MNNDTFYGTKEGNCVSYLEFGQIDLAAGKKTVWDFRLHQKAYDWLMLGRYANDLMAYTTMEREVENGNLEKALAIFDAEVHHAGDFSTICTQLCALAATSGRSFFELGQTLFGCIEGMSFALKLMTHLGIKFPPVDLTSVVWRGVDISDLFNQLAVRMHGGFDVSASKSLPTTQAHNSVFFSKGITLHYAVRSPSQFAGLIADNELCVFDYSLALKSRQETTVGTGKTLLYLGLEEMIEQLDAIPGQLLVKASSKHFPDTGRVWLECIHGNEEACNRFVLLHTRLRNELSGRLDSMEGTERLMAGEQVVEWLPLGSYLDSIGQRGKA